MPDAAWTWKGKDGARGRLLYEPGNWGDLLKMSWLAAFLDWAAGCFGPDGVRYLDPFAGAPAYPLGARTVFRFDQAGLGTLERLRKPFLDRRVWPSAAAAAAFLGCGDVTVFDADAERRALWRGMEGIDVAEAASGWDILDVAEPEPLALWLVDPYDLIAEWRVRLPGILAKAGRVSILAYLYNRSAKSVEAFAEYRAFRGSLDDGTRRTEKRVGRVAADAFLPRAHHEILFLPSEAVAADAHFPALLSGLEAAAAAVNAAQARSGIFDC